MDKEFYKIKFNPNDWLWYKKQVLAVMTVKGWKRIADGTEVRPEPIGDADADDGIEDAQYDWDERNAELISFLILTMSDDTKVYLQNVDGTGHDYWNALEEEFESKTVANKLRLRCSLYSRKMTDSETLDSYVSGIRSTVSQLGSLGIVITNDEKVAVFIVGLPSSYDAVTSNIFMETEIEFDTAVRTVKDFYELKR